MIFGHTAALTEPDITFLMLDVAPTPWSEWGNCASCGVGSARKRVRTCNWPATAAGAGAAVTVNCPTGGSASTVSQITTNPFVADANNNGMLTQSQTQTGICQINSGAISGTPYYDTCNIGDFVFSSHYFSKYAWSSSNFNCPK